MKKADYDALLRELLQTLSSDILSNEEKVICVTSRIKEARKG